MPLQRADYEDVRDRVQPGDVMAFLGDNLLSEIINWAGGAGVSHLGLVTARATETEEPGFVEATVRLSGRKPTFQIRETALRLRCDEYAGSVWWLPIAARRRLRLREDDLRAFVDEIDGRPFDLTGGVAVVVKGLFEQVAARTRNPVVRASTRRELELYFCSELVAEALEAAAVIEPVDGSRASPSDVCRWEIYERDYFQLKGAAREILGYNSLPPDVMAGPIV